MPPTLKQQTVSGFKWLAVNHFGQRLIRLVAMAVLARILDPSVFGLFAMAFIAIDGFSLFKSFGIDGALIRRKDSDPSFEAATHTAFFLVQIIGIVIFLSFQIVAPFFGMILRNQEVVTIMRILGVIFLIGNLGRIPHALLTRKMQFRTISIIELATTILNSVLSVIFALIWPNVWSLVLAYLVKQIFNAGAAWYFEPYRVKFVFDKKIALEMFHFGKFMVGVGLLGYVAFNLDNILISRYLGPAALGFYVLATNITSFTQQQVMNHLGRVLFPAISKIQDDPQMIVRAYLKAVRIISIVAVPFSLGIIAVAREFTLAIYGEKWLSIVPMIQLLALCQLIGPLLGCAGAVFQACDKPKYSYYLQLMQLVLRVALGIPLMLKFGLLGFVYTTIIIEVLNGAIIFILVRRLAKFPIVEYLRQIQPAFICSICMLAAVFAVKALLAFYHWPVMLEFHQVFPLILFAIAGLPVYLLSFYMIDRASVKEVFGLVFQTGKA